MQASDLVIGNFYTDIEGLKGNKLVYTKVYTEGIVEGQHNFDSVDKDASFFGCICDDTEVIKYIEPFVAPKKKAAKKKVAK